MNRRDYPASSLPDLPPAAGPVSVPTSTIEMGL